MRRLLLVLATVLFAALASAEAPPSLGQIQAVRCVSDDGSVYEACGGAGGSGGTSADDNSVFTGGTTPVTPMGALYDTTPPAIADGNVGVPLMDSSRRLRIVCEAGTCGGASPFEDEDAFTVGTSSVSATGYLVDETAPDSAPEDSAAIPRMSPNRVPYSILRDGLGNERGAAVSAANALKVDGSAVTQPVSGTVTVTDGAGALNVICDAGCGGASPFEDEDAFTVGTTSINVTGYVVDETTPDSAPEDSAAAPRMAPNRVPYSILRDGAGNERGAHVTASNALKVDGSAVTQPVSAASLPLPTGAATSANQDGIIRDGSGDTTQANVSSGRLQVDGSGVTQPVSGTVTANQGGAPWSVAGPAADGAAVSGNPVRVAGKDGSGNTQDIATDTSGELQVDVLTLPSVTIGTFPDNEPFNVAQINGVAPSMGNGASGTGVLRVTVANDSTGQIAVASLPNEGTQTAANSISVTVASDIATGATGQPTNAAQALVVRQPVSCTSRIAISQTADTQLITGTSGQRIYICAWLIFANAAETVNLIEGTGSVCATSPTALVGSTTESSGVALPAGGGFAQASGQPFVHTGVDANNLCLTQVGSSRVTGFISYIVAAD